MERSNFFQLLTAILFFSIIHPLASQINDAGLWENIYLEKRVTPKWNIHLNEEGRINQNITNFYYIYADIGLGYKMNKHIHFMFDYVFVERKDKNDLWNKGHQVYFAMTLKQKVGHFILYDRIMPQVQYIKIYSSENGHIPDYQLRNKTTIKYNNNSRFTYYISCELNFKMNSYYKMKKPDRGELARERYFAGVFYELNKLSQIELYYLIEKHDNRYNPTTNFVIGIGYAHVF